ncbi:sigma factor-like helix-turn-helix DNA-binding protein [Streptomyces poonensis]|uniref:RNA polymerase sigma factor 70 region 4 type 2 domain-containing protein n=1 Tax=Streptomyces poonensis TaxID=68255 RepID=A0A918PAF0_9ACTN|nr:sigma factor-like helix-turn-helix DNA-binding protein [Streptomyces poonensis]GGY92376.1 hypothetical protein GCM10010365_08600 [Streptomyces poonensis]GLJ87702.1 hypothetical protein GCM10017589_03020 [Streptomyces poonensis]
MWFFVRKGAKATSGPAALGQGPPPPTPAQAFDALYALSSPALVRQALLLTGRPRLARASVERAFQLAWQRWPEVAVDRDPTGWVRAAAHEYALSPWHRLRPCGKPSAGLPCQALLDVLLELPPPYRRTLLLHDGLGLRLPETAAETEASTPAAAGRLLHAREAVAARLPELADTEQLRRRLREAVGEEYEAVAEGREAAGEGLGPTGERLGPAGEGLGPAGEGLGPAGEGLGAAGEGLGANGHTVRADLVRAGSERRARLWVQAAAAFTALLIATTALTLRTAPDRYEAPVSPGETVEGVPPRVAPGPLSHAQLELREKLRLETARGPHRLVPQGR